MTKMDDSISRQAAIDVISKDWLTSDAKEVLVGALMSLPSAQPNVPDINVGDLISRQAVLNLIAGWTYDLCNKEDEWRAAEEIENLPSAQPEIIRCKDCKWYGRADKRRFYRGMDCLQKRIGTIIPDKDFCSRAERLEE